MVIMASIAALVFSLSGKSVQSTMLQYRQEQAALLAKSYTELAVLSVLNHDREANNNCIQNINGIVRTVDIGVAPPPGTNLRNGGAFQVQTRIYYIGNNMNAHCSNNRWLNRSTNIVTNYNSTGAPHTDALAAVVIDVYVRYKDPNMVAAFRAAHNRNPNLNEIPWITYHRRTIQKI
jgi:hypothetical protein